MQNIVLTLTIFLKHLNSQRNYINKFIMNFQFKNFQLLKQNSRLLVHKKK